MPKLNVSNPPTRDYLLHVGTFALGVRGFLAHPNEPQRRLLRFGHEGRLCRGRSPRFPGKADMKADVHATDRDPVLVGYIASYDLKITVRKLDDLGAVLDDLVKNGANRNVSIATSKSAGCGS